jgi:hypothetical protein
MKDSSYKRIDKKDKERFAVIGFYRNHGRDIKEAEILSPEEDSPIDVIFDGNSFQVKCFPAEAEEVEGRLRSGEDDVVSRRNKNADGKFIKIKGMRPVPLMGLAMTSREMRDSVLEAINNAKIKCPRGSDIILLIYNRHITEDVLEKWTENMIMPENNFKEIYIVNYKKNLRLK